MDCDVLSTHCAFDIKVDVLGEWNEMVEQDIEKEKKKRRQK